METEIYRHEQIEWQLRHSFFADLKAAVVSIAVAMLFLTIVL